MARLKRFTTKKKEMDEELKELGKKVSLVLEKEMQLLGVKNKEDVFSKELMDEVMENREKIKQINTSISEIKESLRNYVERKTERERKIEELEQKIRGKAQSKKDISLLKNKLKNLEALQNKLKSKGVDVSSISGRIENLKLRL